MKMTIAAVGILLLIVVLLSAALLLFTGFETDYLTTNIENYGDYKGVLKEAQEIYIDGFLPDTITEEFQDVRYSFASRTVDTYGFEIYLEFTIEDTETFQSYVNGATSEMESRAFRFDPAYQEYVLPHKVSGVACDWLRLSDNSFTNEAGQIAYHIDSAGIAKILVNPTEQRIIYVVLAVHDGGGTDTGLLHTYFDHLGIDPLECTQHTWEAN